MNISVSRRLSGGFFLVIALLLGITAEGVLGMAKINGSSELILKDRYQKVVIANAILDGINGTAVELRNLLIAEQPAETEAILGRMAQMRQQVTAHLTTLDRELNTDAGRQRLQQIVAARANYALAQQAFLARVAEGDRPEASRVLRTDMLPAQTAYFDQVRALGALVGTLMERSGAEATASYHRDRDSMLALAALATVLAAGFGYGITRSITLPLGRAVEIAKAIADGDLNSTITVDRRDETGQLLQALKDMNASLQRIVGQVRAGTDNINGAATEIAAGNLDLSARTEQQAGALEETAATMEQLTATVRQNAASAAQASALASSASGIAGQGGSVVAEVVDTMASINGASHKIVDIISVIEGIAFQTNILALNAAVEAARAGEQGRGFAVVAAEVRGLAQRSDAAAKEIEALLRDSVDKIERGNRLAADAGQTMAQLVSSVCRVSDIMGEISAASVEQSHGITQVNQAIAQMDAVTQQNAALVEQAAAAAASLQEQAAGLTQTVSVFRLAAAGAAPRPPAAAPARLALA